MDIIFWCYENAMKYLPFLKLQASGEQWCVIDRQLPGGIFWL